jgi:hypothetical protein
MGNQDAPFVADPDDPEYDPTIDNAVVNLVKMTADRTVSFLFPTMPAFEIDPNTIEDTVEEAWIKETLFPENGGLTTLIKWALRGFLAGHSYVWVKNKKPVPRIVVLHPLSVTVFWKADDVAEVLWYEQRYIAQGKMFVRDFVKQDNSTWLIYDYEAKTSGVSLEDKVLDQITAQGNSDAYLNLDNVSFGDNFEIIGKPAVHTDTVPPIIDTAHLPHPDDYYGQSEYQQKDLQDIINRIVSERNKIIRENADPVDIITGASVEEVEAGEGNILSITNEKARVQRLSLTGDLSAVSTTLDKLIESYLAVARVVILKGEAKDLQRVTNAAVRTLFLDALAKNELLRAAYGQALSRICHIALMMAYANGAIGSNPADLKVLVHFPSPLPTDMTEVANINALAIANGYMSGRTAATNLNLNYAFEMNGREADAERKLQEKRAMMELEKEFRESNSL